jgi:hypothetical protein
MRILSGVLLTLWPVVGFHGVDVDDHVRESLEP